MVSLRIFTVLLSLVSLITLGNTATYSNPLRNPNGSDPFIVYTGGYYYLLTTSWTDVEITRATTLNGLKTATPKVVYSTSTASRCCNVWSPEVHYFDGVWYIYYTAGESTDLDGQRIHVLVGKCLDSPLGSATNARSRWRNTMGCFHILRPADLPVGNRRHCPPLHKLGQLPRALLFQRGLSPIPLPCSIDNTHFHWHHTHHFYTKQRMGGTWWIRQRSACCFVPWWKYVLNILGFELLDELLCLRSLDLGWFK